MKSMNLLLTSIIVVGEVKNSFVMLFGEEQPKRV